MKRDYKLYKNDIGESPIIEKGSVIAIEKIKDMVVLKKIEIDLEKQFKNSLEDVKEGRIKKVA